MDIPKNKYLGKLCKKGHDWEGIGKSLRYKTTYRCVVCEKEHHIKYCINNKEKRRESISMYKKKQCKKIRERERKRRKKEVKYLKNNYIKNLLYTYNNLHHKDIPQELVDIKRNLIIAYRLLKGGQSE